MENMEKKLLSLNEVCSYTGWGKTKARQFFHGSSWKPFVR